MTLQQLLLREPEAEAEIRAAMAQRKSELLKLETLERIAGFKRELEQQLESLPSETPDKKHPGRHPGLQHASTVPLHFT